jgi:hypothetical protein
MSHRGRSPLWLIGLIGLLAAVGACQAAAAQRGGAATSNGRLAPIAAGTLTLEAELSVKYPPTPCPAGTPNSIACFARTGTATIRGLGNVRETFPYLVEDFPAGCGADQVRVLPATVQLSIAGKGEIELRVAGSGCLTRVPPDPVEGKETFNHHGRLGQVRRSVRRRHDRSRVERPALVARNRFLDRNARRSRARFRSDATDGRGRA